MRYRHLTGHVVSMMIDRHVVLPVPWAAASEADWAPTGYHVSSGQAGCDVDADSDVGFGRGPA